MAINPSSYERLGQPLQDAAEIATLRMLEAMRVAAGILIASPYMQEQAQHHLEREAKLAAGAFGLAGREWIEDELAEAYLLGIRQTEAELAQLPHAVGGSLAVAVGSSAPLAPAGGSPPAGAPHRFASARFREYPGHLTLYEVFRAAAEDRVELMQMQILRSHRDLFREISIEAGNSAFLEGNEFTRRQLSQDMLDRFARKGVARIRYRDGRLVDLDVYAAMVGRSVTGRAAIQGSLSRYSQYGYDLVVVSAHFRNCDSCAPWEGRVLSQSGSDSRRPSLSDAIAGGLFHPNCRHDVTPWFPGMTERPKPTLSAAERELASEHGLQKAREIVYDAEQYQRSIERRIRRAKRSAAVAPKSGVQRVQKDVRELQAQMREHLTKHPFLPRKYVREQIARAH